MYNIARNIWSIMKHEDSFAFMLETCYMFDSNEYPLTSINERVLTHNAVLRIEELVHAIATYVRYVCVTSLNELPLLLVIFLRRSLLVVIQDRIFEWQTEGINTIAFASDDETYVETSREKKNRLDKICLFVFFFIVTLES